MIFHWQHLGLLLLILLIIEYVYSSKQSEYSAYLKLLDDPYETMFSSPTTTAFNYSTNRRTLSLQMTQTNKLSSPKCSRQHHECRRIGIVGAGEFFFPC